MEGASFRAGITIEILEMGNSRSKDGRVCGIGFKWARCLCWIVGCPKDEFYSEGNERSRVFVCGDPLQRGPFSEAQRQVGSKGRS